MSGLLVWFVLYLICVPSAVRLWQIGLNPGTGRYENSSQFAGALQLS